MMLYMRKHATRNMFRVACLRMLLTHEPESFLLHDRQILNLTRIVRRLGSNLFVVCPGRHPEV